MKKLLSMLLVLAMVFSLAACGTQQKPADASKNPTNSSEVAEPSESESSKPDETSTIDESISSEPVESDEPSQTDEEAYKQKANYKIIERFVETLKNADYDTMMTMIEYPANSIVQKDDLIYWMTRSDFGELIEAQTIEILNFEGSAASSSATLKVGPDMVDVRAYLADDNNWYIDLSASYEKDATVLAPAKTTITLNGVELNYADAKKHSNKQGRVIYTVTIPRRSIVATYDSAFGAIEKELESRNNADSEAKYTICQSEWSDEIKDELLTALQAKLNEMFALYESGNMEIASWQALFDDKTSTEDIEAVQAAVKEMYTWNSKIANLKVASMLQRTDSQFYIIANNVMLMNVQYETSYDATAGWTTQESSKVFGAFCLAKLEDGSYVLSSLYPVSKNFSSHVTNSMTRDW